MHHSSVGRRLVGSLWTAVVSAVFEAEGVKGAGVADWDGTFGWGEFEDGLLGWWFSGERGRARRLRRRVVIRGFMVDGKIWAGVSHVSGRLMQCARAFPFKIVTIAGITVDTFAISTD